LYVGESTDGCSGVVGWWYAGEFSGVVGWWYAGECSGVMGWYSGENG
jgi:hypothetical protein